MLVRKHDLHGSTSLVSGNVVGYGIDHRSFLILISFFFGGGGLACFCPQKSAGESAAWYAVEQRLVVRPRQS